MKAYLSYSLNDEQQFVVTVLAQVLREKDYDLVTGGGHGLRVLPGAYRNPWMGCGLFIGVITQRGIESDRVLDEYSKAIDLNIPSLLLVDETIAKQAGIEPRNGIVTFNASYPQAAMESVRHNVRQAHIHARSDETGAWVLGGLGVLTLIALLSTRK